MPAPIALDTARRWRKPPRNFLLSWPVLVDAIDWLEDDHLEACPLWHGLTEGRAFLLWKDGQGHRRQRRDQGPRSFRWPSRRAGCACGAAGTSPFEEVPSRGPAPGYLAPPRRRSGPSTSRGVEQARAEDTSELRERSVIGLAHCKRARWVLAGVDPFDEAEESRLEKIRAEIGFDPRISSHELTVKVNNRQTGTAKFVRRRTDARRQRPRVPLLGKDRTAYAPRTGRREWPGRLSEAGP